MRSLVPHLPITEIRQRSPNTGTCTHKHIHYRKTGNIQLCCTTAWLTHSNVVLLNLFVHEKKQTTFLQDHSDLNLPLSGAAQPHISSEQLETTKGSKCQRNNHGAEKPLTLQKPQKEQCIKQKKNTPKLHIAFAGIIPAPVITSDSVLTSNSYLSFS